jgi:hypothetical protein
MLILLQILIVVTYIFNIILTTAVYPAAWTTFKIMPIAKKNEPSNMSAYRPISVPPTRTKAIATIIKRQVSSF